MMFGLLHMQLVLPQRYKSKGGKWKKEKKIRNNGTYITFEEFFREEKKSI
jgi:hypothetical protein